jgi:hypothetical protein
VEFASVVCIATALLLLSGGNRSTFSNTYILFAHAILNGHLWIDWPGRVIDAAAFNGQHWVIDGPAPVLLALPMVVWFGPTANQTTIAIALAIVATALAWFLLYNLGVQRAPRLWLMLFFFAGTDLWWCAQLGDAQFIAQVAAVTATLAALLESLGKRRGWLTALYAIAAIESRYALVMAVPLYLLLLRGEARQSFVCCLWFGLVGWMGYNEARFGTVYDQAHYLFYAQDPAAGAAAGAKTGGPLSIAYVPYNLYSFFLRAPTLIDGGMNTVRWPILGCDPQGIALTFTSPALILAFLARRRALVIALWVTVVLVAGPNVLNYTDGFWNFGMRHALDFEPFLLVLMALAVRDRMPRWGAMLCAWSALAGAWGVVWWNMTYRNAN